MIPFFKDYSDPEHGIVPSCDECGIEDAEGVGMYAWQRSKGTFALVLCFCQQCYDKAA